MGYRSDVDYLFYTGVRGVKDIGGAYNNEPIGPFAVLKLWFDENFPKHDYATITVGDDYIRVQYHGVKWYEGYEDVEAVNAATASFDECFNTDDYDCMTGKWEMVRLGEEDNDIEHDGSPHHDWRLHIHREVTLT